MWKNIKTDNKNIIWEEEYKNSCWIKLEKFPEHYKINCGVYGEMYYSVYCKIACHEKYNSMKQELQDFIDRDTTIDEKYKFYDYFMHKY